MTGQFDRLGSRRGPPPTLVEIEALAATAYAGLPAHFRALCEDPVIQVTDFPSVMVVEAMKLGSEYDLLGLFQGIGLPSPDGRP